MNLKILSTTFLLAEVIISCTTLSSTAIPLPKPVKFTSKDILRVLEWVDGITNLIDGLAIKDLNKVTYLIQALQYGLEDTKTKKMVGKYSINQKRYTIRDLAQLEANNKIPAKDEEAVEQILKEACDDFGKIVGPFENRVKGLKHFLTELITEGCKIRNNMDSPLLDWSTCKGNEGIVLTRRILAAGKEHKGFQLLNKFYTDLLIFFEDLKFNCPKACKQYDELKRLAGGSKK